MGPTRRISKHYRDVKAANVLSTRFLARMCLPRRTTIHYASSVGVSLFQPSPYPLLTPARPRMADIWTRLYRLQVDQRALPGAREPAVRPPGVDSSLVSRGAEMLRERAGSLLAAASKHAHVHTRQGGLGSRVRGQHRPRCRGVTSSRTNPASL